MPTYTFYCQECEKDFEIYFSLKDYCGKAHCPTCSVVSEQRNLQSDLPVGSVVARTLGTIAEKNTRELSKDKKDAMTAEFTAYLDDNQKNPLPKGMKRIPKPDKAPKWT